MAGLPKPAEIAKNLSNELEPEPAQSKTEETDTSEPAEKQSSESTEPPAAAEGGLAKSAENRVPYDRFKEVNEKLKEAHEVIANFERRFQTLESASVSASGQEEATQPEVTLSDKITSMIEDGEIGEGAAELMKELAAKVETGSTQGQFLHELQLERATAALGTRIDTAMKGATVADNKGARLFLAQSIQSDPNVDLADAVNAWVAWEGEYEQQILDRFGFQRPESPDSDTETKVKEGDPPPTASRVRGGGGGSASSKAKESSDSDVTTLKDIRRRLTKRRRTGR